MNRADLLRALIAHKAAVEALEAALKRPVQEAFDQEHVVAPVKIPGVGEVRVSLTSSSVEVADEAALTKWLATRYPGEVITETVTVTRPRNPAWVRHLVAQLDPVDPEEVGPGGATQCVDGQGELVPGVVWRRGGTLRSVSICSDADLQTRYRQAALAYVAQGVPMPAILAAAPREEATP